MSNIESRGGIQFTIYRPVPFQLLGIIKMLVEMGVLSYLIFFVLLTPVPASPAQAPQVQAKMQ